MFGNLFGRMTTDDSVEHIELANMHKNVQNSVALQATLRQRSMGMLEGDLDDALEENNRKAQEIRDNKLKIEKLEKENQALKETAVRIAVDRRAIFNTIEYLNNKWGVQSPRSSSSNTLLFDEAEEKRQEELKRMMANEEYLESVAGEVETFSKHNIKTNNMLLKKKAK